jgi:hypothetical protein
VASTRPARTAPAPRRASYSIDGVEHPPPPNLMGTD